MHAQPINQHNYPPNFFNPLNTYAEKLKLIENYYDLNSEEGGEEDGLRSNFIDIKLFGQIDSWLMVRKQRS